MSTFRIVMRNIDGTGARRCRVFDLAPAGGMDYWSAVTDVQCPALWKRCYPLGRGRVCSGLPHLRPVPPALPRRR